MAVHSAGIPPVHYSLKLGPYSSHSLVLAAFAAERQGATVLDLGCAHGELAAILAARGFRVTGIERAGCTGPDFPESVHLIVADLEAGLPRLPARYDYVLCADILEHLRDPSELLGAIPFILTPSGALIASLPNSGNIYFRLNILCGRFPQDDKGLFDRTHLHFYMWDGWRHLFERCGFRIQQVTPSGIPVTLALPAIAGTPLGRFADWFCAMLARTWKRLFAYQFIVVATPLSPSEAP